MAIFGIILMALCSTAVGYGRKPLLTRSERQRFSIPSEPDTPQRWCSVPKTRSHSVVVTPKL